MERCRESPRGASALRRLRISCPKDSADAEARMDETPLIERFRKGNLHAFPVSFAAQVGSTAPAWSKKKRHVLQETQTLPQLRDSGIGSVEKAEKLLYEDDDDEAALLPSSTPFGRSRSRERAKEDERVMDMSNIPRRARSSGSRLSTLRRQEDYPFTFTVSRKVPTSYQQRSPSPNLLAKRPVGRKNRPLKDFRVMGNPQISDQEVEVAEVLFDLSRSKPSVVKSSNLRCQNKSGRGMEDEELETSSSQAVGSSSSEYMQKSSSPSLDEPKRKRQHSFIKQEEVSEKAGSGVEPVGLDELPKKQNICSEECKQKRSSEIMTPLCYGISQMQAVDDKNAICLEQRSDEIDTAKVMKRNNANYVLVREGLVPPGPGICKAGLSVQVSYKDGERSKSSIRSHEDQQANGTKSKADLVHLSQNLTPEGEERNIMETNIERPSLSASFAKFLKNGCEKLYPGLREVSSGNIVGGIPARDLESTGRVLSNEGKQQQPKQMSCQLKKQQNDIKVLHINKENDFEVLDQGAHSACLSRRTLPSPMVTCSTSIGSPPWSNHAKVAPPWSTDAFLLGSNHGKKMSSPTSQGPHTSAQALLKRRRCATHVFVAHYIQQRQQFLRQTFWPLAYHGGAAYHSSTLPANLEGSEQRTDKNAHIPSMQLGWAPLGECRGTKMPNSKSPVTSNSLHEFSAGAVTATYLGHVTAGGTRYQYPHNTGQQNGCVSLYMPSNKLSSQNASVFDKSSYHVHSLPIELQPSAQQTHSSSHPPRRQVPPSSPQVGFSNSLLAQPHFQRGQKEQQHQHYTAIPSRYHGAAPDGHSGGDQKLSTSNQSIHSHQQAQLQGNQAASPSDPLLSHQLNSEPKGRNVNLVAGEIDLLHISCKDKATGSPAQLDLATSASAATAHGGYDQQLQILESQHQYCYHRSYPRMPAALSTNIHCIKEQSSIESQFPMMQGGSSTDGSKAMENYLPVSLTRTCGGPAPIHEATILQKSEHTQDQASAKPVIGSDILAGKSVETTTGGSVENVLAGANLATFPASPQRTVSCTQDMVKATHTSGCSNGSHASSLNPEQQVWSNLQNTVNCLPHSDFASRPSCATSLCAMPQSPSLIVAGTSTLSNKCFGEGLGPASQGDVLRKNATTNGLNSEKIASTRLEAQLQGQSQCQTMFPQEQSIKLHQNRHQVYEQPYPPTNKDVQLAQQRQLQRQLRSLRAQLVSPQAEIKSSLQQSHHHKQLQFVPSNVSLSNGLLPNATLGTASQGKTITGKSVGQMNTEK